MSSVVNISSAFIVNVISDGVKAARGVAGSVNVSGVYGAGRRSAWGK